MKKLNDKNTVARAQKPTRFVQLGAYVLSMCMALSLTIGANADAASLRLTPSTTSVGTGEAFSLDLLGADLVDLYSFQFALTFDPSQLRLIGVTEGAALATAGTTFFVPGASDNVNGRLDLTGNTLIGAIPGFSGSGVLAKVSFLGFAPGSSRISLTDLLVLDSSLGIVEPEPSSVDVTVSGTVGVIPEPSTYALFALGLCALVLSKRRQGSN